MPVSNPSIQSATSIFSSANWQERETFDFYGIIFEGHPNLKRIINVDEMDYFPMRKEYPLVAGIYAKVEDAQKAMGQGFETTYFPDAVNAEKYGKIYLNYLKLGKFTEEEL